MNNLSRSDSLSSTEEPAEGQLTLDPGNSSISGLPLVPFTLYPPRRIQIKSKSAPGSNVWLNMCPFETAELKTWLDLDNQVMCELSCLKRELHDGSGGGRFLMCTLALSHTNQKKPANHFLDFKFKPFETYRYGCKATKNESGDDNREESEENVEKTEEPSSDVENAPVTDDLSAFKALLTSLNYDPITIAAITASQARERLKDGNQNKKEKEKNKKQNQSSKSDSDSEEEDEILSIITDPTAPPTTVMETILNASTVSGGPLPSLNDKVKPSKICPIDVEIGNNSEKDCNYFEVIENEIAKTKVTEKGNDSNKDKEEKEEEEDLTKHIFANDIAHYVSMILPDHIEVGYNYYLPEDLIQSPSIYLFHFKFSYGEPIPTQFTTSDFMALYDAPSYAMPHLHKYNFLAILGNPRTLPEFYEVQMVRQVMNFMTLHDTMIGILANETHIRFIAKGVESHPNCFGYSGGSLWISRPLPRDMVFMAGGVHATSCMGYIAAMASKMARQEDMLPTWPGIGIDIYRSSPCDIYERELEKLNRDKEYFTTYYNENHEIDFYKFQDHLHLLPTSFVETSRVKLLEETFSDVSSLSSGMTGPSELSSMTSAESATESEGTGEEEDEFFRAAKLGSESLAITDLEVMIPVLINPEIIENVDHEDEELYYADNEGSETEYSSDEESERQFSFSSEETRMDILESVRFDPFELDICNGNFLIRKYSLSSIVDDDITRTPSIENLFAEQARLIDSQKVPSNWIFATIPHNFNLRNNVLNNTRYTHFYEDQSFAPYSSADSDDEDIRTSISRSSQIMELHKQRISTQFKTTTGNYYYSAPKGNIRVCNIYSLHIDSNSVKMIKDSNEMIPFVQLRPPSKYEATIRKGMGIVFSNVPKPESYDNNINDLPTPKQPKPLSRSNSIASDASSTICVDGTPTSSRASRYESFWEFNMMKGSSFPQHRGSFAISPEIIIRNDIANVYRQRGTFTISLCRYRKSRWFEICQSQKYSSNKEYVSGILVGNSVELAGEETARKWEVVIKNIGYNYRSSNSIRNIENVYREISIYQYLQKKFCRPGTVPDIYLFGDIWNTNKMLVMKPWGRKMEPQDVRNDFQCELGKRFKKLLARLHECNVALNCVSLDTFGIDPRGNIRIVELRNAFIFKPRFAKVVRARGSEAIEKMITRVLENPDNDALANEATKLFRKEDMKEENEIDPKTLLHPESGLPTVINPPPSRPNREQPSSTTIKEEEKILKSKGTMKRFFSSLKK